MKTFTEAKYHGNDLMKSESRLHSMQRSMDEMIQMEWKGKPTGKGTENVKFTTSPDARNEFLGAVRLLTAVDPIIKVPYDVNNAVAKAEADNIERICKAVWYHSGRNLQKPVHYELVNSLLRYGVFHLAIVDTEDLYIEAEKNNKMLSKAAKFRYKRLSESTPFLFQPLDPKCGAAEFDSLGLCAYYRETKMTASEIRSIFGDLPQIQNYSPSDFITYKDYWDLDVHFAWIDDIPEPIIGLEDNGVHNLPRIPIVVQGAEGSLISPEAEYKYQPLLYGLWKGELWDRMNLELTALFTNLYNVAANAMFVHERGIEDSAITVDFDNVGGIVHLQPGDKLYPLQRDVFNKDALVGMDILDRLTQESTLYKQVFGREVPERTAFSTVALLSQSGRLPLVAAQRAGGWGIGTAFETMFSLIKDKQKIRTALINSRKINIDPAELPDDLIIDVTLDADLPQDKLQQANVAGMLKQYGLASNSWIRENILNIGQSGDMDKEIIEEQFVNKMVGEYLTNQMQNEIMQNIQAQAQAQQQAQQEQQAVPEQFNPAKGGMPPIVGKGAIPATRPGQQPTPPSPLAQVMQQGEQ